MNQYLFKNDNAALYVFKIFAEAHNYQGPET